jgi:hypothetical protein
MRLHRIVKNLTFPTAVGSWQAETPTRVDASLIRNIPIPCQLFRVGFVVFEDVSPAHRRNWEGSEEGAEDAH